MHHHDNDRNANDRDAINISFVGAGLCACPYHPFTLPRIRHVFIMIIIALLIFISPTPSQAASPPEGMTHRQMLALERAEIAVTQAIGNIEAASGARVIEVSTEPVVRDPRMYFGPLIFALLTIKDGKLVMYYVDIFSGNVLRKLDGWLVDTVRHVMPVSQDEIFAKAKVNLVQAITLAEKETQGKTLMASTFMADGIPCYRVRLLVNNSLLLVHIDAFNGKFTPVEPQTLKESLQRSLPVVTPKAKEK